MLPPNRSEFTPNMFKFYVSIPIIIIDGKKGPVKVGTLPLYQVPKLLLKMLNYDEPSIMDYASPLPDMRVRPLPGLHFNLLKDGKVDLYKEPPYSETCQTSARWLQNVLVVSNDLFIGRQYTRPKHQTEQQEETGPREVAAPPANISEPEL